MKLRKLHADFLAIFLILSEPYLEFSYLHRFTFEATNLYVLSVYVAVALAIAALLAKFPNRLFGSLLFTASIVLFLDLRLDLINKMEFQILYIVIPAAAIFWIFKHNTSKILAPIFGIMLIAVLLTPAFPRTYNANTEQVADQTVEDLPVYIHIILDEQIGVEGIGPKIRDHEDAKNALKEFFIPNGFRLFGRAYTEFLSTKESIPRMLGIEGDDNQENYILYKQKLNNNVILNNGYFSLLNYIGYKIRVYQSTWLDFCKGSTERLIDSCHTYNATGVSEQGIGKLHPFEKIDVRLTMFWRKSFVKEKLYAFYIYVSSVIQSFGQPMPNWPRPERNDLVGPIPVLPVFDTLINDVSQASPGTMFFAHLLIPHQPYSVRSDCSIRRPVLRWKKVTPSPKLKGDFQNTIETRQDQYDDYFEQTNCALSKLADLVERMKTAGIFDDATIVVHGDHGSRIGLTLPTIQNRNRLTPEDFYDGYSTLFAVKAPQIEAGYDLTMLPLSQLLRGVMEGRFAIPEKSAEHFVYLDDHRKSALLRVPMPEIPGVDLHNSN